MLPRLLSIVVVLFWGASMAWLCAVVWAPPESRMARVDPREVYKVFFEWNESTNMTLLENGVRRGQITIAGGSGEDPDAGRFLNSLSVSGMLESLENTSDGGTPEIDLFWRGLLDFSEDLLLQTGDFSVRVPRQQLTAHFSMGRKETPVGEPAADREGSSTGNFDYAARAMMRQQLIFDFDSKRGQGAALPLHMLSMQSLPGLPPIDPSAIRFETEARMGKFSFGGRDLRAYLLILTTAESGESVRIFLSEVGEPLRIETDYGFEAVSEMLVPLDAYTAGRKSVKEKEHD